MKVQGFTTDVDLLQKFVWDAENTGGGDIPECYELALYTAKEIWQKDWREGNITKDKVNLEFTIIQQPPLTLENYRQS